MRAVPFDLIGFARELLALQGHAELLSFACRTAAQSCGERVFAYHVLPGRAWELATVLSSDNAPGPAPAPVRSALFAIHRRLSLAPGALRLERTPDAEAIFRALLPTDATRLCAFPVRGRGGRLSGAIVTGQPAGAAAEDSLAALEHIAALAGPAMEAAWRHSLALRDQERLQLFSETTEESLWDWHVGLDEVWWGGNLEQLFGGAVRVSQRRDWRRTRIHHDDAGRVLASFDEALAGSASSWSAEYRLHGADGKVIHVREHVYFLREVDGRAYRAIGTVRDVSALQGLLQREMLARADAERASNVKDEFLAMLGHELRNPLAPIVSVLTLLERRAGGPDRDLEILRRQTQHLVRLVDDLLDVSRISTGKVELAPRTTLVEPLVQRALEMVQPLIEARRHRVYVDIAPDLRVEADAVRMTQVLSNLLANAAKYTEPGGHVQVSARAENGEAVVRVRDDGIGIAAEFLPHVFDMFTQVQQAPDRAQGGLGLGLSIVRNIVQLHGGTVQAHSDGMGRGTEVVIRLPAARPEQAAPGASGPPPPGAKQPLDLLVVDDNEDAAAVLQAWLSISGHTVRIAYHPETALKLFVERRPSVAVVDIGLPGMDGYELVRRMRLHPGGTDTRFVALTGYGLPADKARALEAGFDAHIVKPASPNGIEQVIEALADRTGR